MKNIYLIGGGGHCNSCIDVIEQENKYHIKGIFDLPENIGKNILGYNVIGADSDIKSYIKRENFFLVTIGQIGNPGKRLSYLKLNLATISEFAFFVGGIWGIAILMWTPSTTPPGAAAAAPYSKESIS